jgi:hypothetical protein
MINGQVSSNFKDKTAKIEHRLARRLTEQAEVGFLSQIGRSLRISQLAMKKRTQLAGMGPEGQLKLVGGHARHWQGSRSGKSCTLMITFRINNVFLGLPFEWPATESGGLGMQVRQMIGLRWRSARKRRQMPHALRHKTTTAKAGDQDQ